MNTAKKIKKIIIFFLMLTTIADNLSAMQFVDNADLQKKLNDMFRGISNDMNRMGEASAQRRRDYDNQMADLKAAEQKNINYHGENSPEVARVRQQMKNIENSAKQYDKFADMGANFVNRGANVALDVIGAELKSGTEMKAEKNRIEAQGQNDLMKMHYMLQADNLKRIGFFLALTTIGIAGGYYGVKLLYNYVEAEMGKPDLVRDSSRQGAWQSVKKYFSSMIYGTEEMAPQLTDIVLSPEIEKKAYLLADDIKQTREYGLPYQNILFYGPPGTGKTEFAKILARYSEMDYAILSGADFAQFKDGEGITELHNLFAWANNSPYGLLIFIDEADACLRDRATLDKDAINLVNAFLSHTGGNSNKFMIVLATNYEDELDGAVRSRIHKKVPFFLPNATERVRILKKKIEKYILDDSRTYEHNGETITVTLALENGLNDEFLAALSDRMTGFSGRDIDQTVSDIRLRAYRSGTNQVTKELVEMVVKDKIVEIEKDKLTTAYQHDRSKKARDKGVAVAEEKTK